MSRCVHCGVATRVGYTTDVYRRDGTDTEVTVAGIPADVCPSGRESYVDLDTAKEIEGLIAPVFEAAVRQGRLPAPQVRVDFPVPVPAKAA